MGNDTEKFYFGRVHLELCLWHMYLILGQELATGKDAVQLEFFLSQKSGIPVDLLDGCTMNSQSKNIYISITPDSHLAAICRSKSLRTLGTRLGMMENHCQVSIILNF